MGIRSTTWKRSSTHNGREPVTGPPTGSHWDGRRDAGKHPRLTGPIARLSKCWDIRWRSTSGVCWRACEHRQYPYHEDLGEGRELAPSRPFHPPGSASDVRVAGDDHPSSGGEIGS